MRSIGFDTKPLRHFPVSFANAQEIYALAEKYPKCNRLLCIANSCRDLMRGTKIYNAREDTMALLISARNAVSDFVIPRSLRKDVAERK